MICTLLKRRLSFFCRSVVAFLDRSVSGAMGCFFGCFRVKNDRHRLKAQLLSDSSVPKHRGLLVSRGPLSSIFFSEETVRNSSRKDKEANCFGSPLNAEELKDEAKFLKSCGTILETPIEIRKATQKLHSSPPCDRDSKPSNFHSWLSNTSSEAVQLDIHPDQPSTPIKFSEEWTIESNFSEHTPGSCITSERRTERIPSNTIVTETGCLKSAINFHAYQSDNMADSTPDIRCRSKSVRFECDTNSSDSRVSFSDNESQDGKKVDSPGNRSMSKPSPNPTPLRLSDEMQTPGTVFPSNMEPNGNTRIRSQYVYPILNPVQNVSQWKALKDEDDGSDRFSGELKESIEQPENATPMPVTNGKETSSGKDVKVVASFSAWLRQSKSSNENDDGNIEAVRRGYHFDGTPGDRPIIGLVAEHWNKDEPSQIKTKWWDGNGIPNTTTKYKEDQKVSWHATPFEERLEKALSEEGNISQRKNFHGEPIYFEPNEESNTAQSRLQSSTQPSSAVSFC